MLLSVCAPFVLFVVLYPVYALMVSISRSEYDSDLSVLHFWALVAVIVFSFLHFTPQHAFVVIVPYLFGCVGALTLSWLIGMCIMSR